MSIKSSVCWKGIAILLVVLGHLKILPLGGQMGVIIFLVLSGYGLSASYLKNGLKDYWNKRLRGVWLPYVIWEASIAIYLYIIGAENVKSFINVLGSVLALKPSSVLDAQWYVTYIMIFYIAFFLVNKLNITPIKKSISLGVVGVFLGILSLINIIPRYAGAWYYSFCFASGMIFFELRRKGYKLGCYKFVRIASVIMVVVLYILSLLLEGILCYGFIMIFSLLFTATVIMVMEGEQNNRILIYIGKHSYWIFLCNTFLISTISNIYVKKGYDFSFFSRLTAFLIILLIGIVLSLIYETINRRINQIF